MPYVVSYLSIELRVLSKFYKPISFDSYLIPSKSNLIFT